MLIVKNPSDEKLQEIINISKDKAAKWIEDPETKDKYFWPFDQAFHVQVAKKLHIPKFEKGIATF
ncbi:MAG: hypothetical protein HOM14_15925 [Gammaproteobacteria bacterium]|jgi:hypothetical protein|nr:hypothetical protein [Gammaproteobacteria bacterium]MBT3725844.1 hypothetical protein [Gammaproteobacteria bacterium]MBT4195723.1 hypothetical protein [Gammaproteobacteria bacterium]MBT4450800.1 hypothetical protein [Gammaproteobacteria bacterium]MBT4860504.1 hypothetical protein [Gammaproteobacteria bacterium]